MNSIMDWFGINQQNSSGQHMDWDFRFLSTYGPYVNFLLILVLAALVYLTIRSYVREGDARPAIKALLAGLRLALIVIIIAILFQPAVVFRMVKTLHSVVLVLPDTSQSMSFTDSYGTDAAARQRMADYFGVDPAKLSDKSRQWYCKEAMLRKDGALTKLAKDHPLNFMPWSTTQPGKQQYVNPAGTVDVVKDDDSNPASKEPPQALKAIVSKLSENGYETNFAVPIRDSLDLVQGQRVQAILFFTDGQPTGEDIEARLSAALDYAKQRGVPLYTIMVGDPTLPRNVWVTGLKAPREARKGSEVEFTATLVQRNMDDQTVTVKLLRRRTDQKEWSDVDHKDVRILKAERGPSGTKGIQEVSFKTKPESSEAGLADKKKYTEYVYRAVVEMHEGVNETKDRTKPASAEALVRIVDSKINVLIIAGDSGWEFQYLRNLIQRQGDLYRVSVWQQNAEAEVSQAASSEELRLEKMPRDLVDLIGDPKNPKKPGYQAVILYDPQRTRDGFDDQFAKILKQFVGDHGGGLCYIAGHKYTDDNLLTRGLLKDLATLLPVELAINKTELENLLGERPPEAWHAQVTGYGVDHQITRFGESDSNSALKIWEQLPGIFWSHSVMKIKPAARVLVENENPSRLTARGEKEPLVALQMYGSGPVIYIGTNDTWRWRAVEDAKFHKLFWNNIVGFLATLKASHVIITTGGDNFNVGERIKIDAEAYDEKYRPMTEKTLVVEIRDSDTGKLEKELPLAKIQDKDGRYRGEYTPARQGRFEVTYKKIEGVEAKRFIVRVPEVEAVRTEANEEVLKSMVNDPQKNFLRIWETDKLSSMIPSGKLTSIQEDPRELIDLQWPWSLIPIGLLVILLSIEWILRKKFNMA